MQLTLGTARRGLLALAVAASAAMLHQNAKAYDASVDASLDVQYYSLASPFGDPVVARRRYTSTLGLDLRNLEGEPARDGPTLTFRSRLRVDADFGIRDGERDSMTNQYVPGLSQAPLDLMYAYLEGAGFGDGLFGFRLGRQYVVDGLGFWSFDGARVSVTLPLAVELSAFAGFEQRSGLPILGTPRFAADGVWRGDRSGLPSFRYPSFLDDSALAPAAGVLLETVALKDVYVGVSYRKVQSRSTVLVSPFLNEQGEVDVVDQTRTASERFSASARLDISDVSVSTSTLYDLYVQRVGEAAAALDWYATGDLRVGADIDYVYPTYDGDSIFNWFSHGPSTRAQGRLVFTSQALEAVFGWGVRLFETTGDPHAPPSLAAATPDEATRRHAEALVNASARHRFGNSSLTLSGVGERGDTGHRAGADLTATRTYLGGSYDGLVVLSLYDWSDNLRTSRDATSFTYVLGAGMLPSANLVSRGRLGLEWEHSMNRLVGQRFRLLFTVDLTVLR